MNNASARQSASTIATRFLRLKSKIMWKWRSFFFGLYFLQGAALAYVVNFQKPYLADQGISKSTLGLFTSLLLLPFILKVLLGLVSDRWPMGRWGKRKPYMVFGLILFGAGYLALSGWQEGEPFWHFAALTWLASFGLAWFDTCADAMAIDLADDREASNIQASMVAGKSGGLICMSLAFGILAETWGVPAIFKVLALLALIVMAVIMWIQVPMRKPIAHAISNKSHPEWSKFHVLMVERGWLWLILFGVGYSIPSFGADGLMTLFLRETRDLSFDGIGAFGVSRGIGALFGAVVFAITARRYGVTFSTYGGLVALAGGCLLPVLGVSTGALGLLWGAAWGFQETSFVTMAMWYSRGAWAASLFATCMIFSNIGTALGEAIAAPLVQSLNYSGVFLVLAAGALGTLIVVPKLLACSYNSASSARSSASSALRS